MPAPRPVTGLAVAAALALSACAPAPGAPSGPGGSSVPSGAPSGAPGSGRSAVDPEVISGDGRWHVLVWEVDPAAGTVNVDAVQLFTGAAAGRACAEDGVPGHRGGLCDAYYLRDRSPRRWTLPVDPDATVTLLARPCAGPRPATLRQVAGGLARHRFFRLATAAGRVTHLTESCPP